MTAVAVFDPSTLGTDVNLAMGDLPGVWGLASELVNVGNAWVRRLACPPGGLVTDDQYGHDVFGLLNADLSAADLASEQGKIAAQIELDERCDTCRAAVVMVRQTEQLFIVLDGKLATGQPFQFVIAAANLNIFLLAVNGIQVAGTSAIGQAAAAAGAPVQLVVGPPGSPGPKGEKGDAGAAGTPQVTLDFDESGGATDSGNQDVVKQRLVNFDALPGTVTFELVGDVYSVSGTALIKIRYGGTSRAADGTQVGATISTGSSTPTPLSTSAAIANPGGKRLVKVTVQSSGADIEAGIQDAVLTIR